jgi:hypothetical protein
MRINKHIHWKQVTRNEMGYTPSPMAEAPVTQNISNFILRNQKNASMVKKLDQIFNYLYNQVKQITKTRCIAIHRNLNNYL